MDTELLKWLAPLVITVIGGPATFLGGAYFERRKRVATTTGLELDNEGKALSLYDRMLVIAQETQDRLDAALDEHDAMRTQLAECVAARDAAARREVMREQQRNIEKTAAELITAKQNHRIAELEMLVRTGTTNGGDG